MASTKMSVTMEVGSDAVAVITFSNPLFNALSSSIFAGLKERYVEAMRRNDVKALVLTGDGGKFSSGFDINVFQTVHKSGDNNALPDNSFDFVLNTIEDAKKPSVATIKGLAFGGGLEVAMGCAARIAVPKTQVALPELSLGVIPELGGTQRLPRLHWLICYLPTTSAHNRQIIVRQANYVRRSRHKPWIVDAVVSSKDLLKLARIWALDIAERHKPWITSLSRDDKLISLSEALETLKAAR